MKELFSCFSILKKLKFLQYLKMFINKYIYSSILMMNLNYSNVGQQIFVRVNF